MRAQWLSDHAGSFNLIHWSKRMSKTAPRRLTRPRLVSMPKGTITALGRELWDVIQRQPEFNTASTSATWPGDRERSVLWDRQIHLENSITMLPAGTATDALAQLVVAYSMLTRLVDDYPDPDTRVEPQGNLHATAASRASRVSAACSQP